MKKRQKLLPMFPADFFLCQSPTPGAPSSLNRPSVRRKRLTDTDTINDNKHVGRHQRRPTVHQRARVRHTICYQ